MVLESLMQAVDYLIVVNLVTAITLLYAVWVVMILVKFYPETEDTA